MRALLDYLEKVNFEDKRFIGTIALKNEGISLPDGSKMAMGIDDGHWVLVYQKAAGASFQVFKFNQPNSLIFVDQKPGGEEELKTFRKLLEYFFIHAKIEELVTILPPRG